MWNSLTAEADVDDLYVQPECSVYPSYRNIADPASLERALEALQKAENPLIICGQGALSSGASQAVQKLAELLFIPVGTTTSASRA